VTEVMKRVAEQWREATKEEKDFWQAESEKDKLRYKEEVRPRPGRRAVHRLHLMEAASRQDSCASGGVAVGKLQGAAEGADQGVRSECRPPSPCWDLSVCPLAPSRKPGKGRAKKPAVSTLPPRRERPLGPRVI
jgi:hypothetical protein